MKNLQLKRFNSAFFDFIIVPFQFVKLRNTNEVIKILKRNYLGNR